MPINFDREDGQFALQRQIKGALQRNSTALLARTFESAPFLTS
jgi:hypothetical protein